MSNAHRRAAPDPTNTGAKPLRELIHRLGMGYRVVFRSLIALLVLVGATAAVAVVIVLPLWYGAKHAPQIYSAGVVMILSALTLAVPVRSMIRLGRRLHRGELQPAFFRRRFRAVGVTVLILAMGYLAAVLAVRGYPVAAIGTMLGCLVLIGLAASRRSASHAGGP